MRCFADCLEQTTHHDRHVVDAGLDRTQALIELALELGDAFGHSDSRGSCCRLLGGVDCLHGGGASPDTARIEQRFDGNGEL